jgi:hypothetical protein
VNGLFPVILPLASIAAVATVMLSLGVLFIYVGATLTIVIGLAIIVLVPLAGALLTRNSKDAPS